MDRLRRDARQWAGASGIAAYLDPTPLIWAAAATWSRFAPASSRTIFCRCWGFVRRSADCSSPTTTACQGRIPVAVVSHGMWQSRFAGAADAIGRTLLVNGVCSRLSASPRSDFTGIEADGVDVWLPSSMAGPLGLRARRRRLAQARGLFARYVARLAPGARGFDRRDSGGGSAATARCRRGARSDAGSGDVSRRAGGSAAWGEGGESVAVAGARRRARAHHCVRECGEPAAGARDHAPPRARRSGCRSGRASGAWRGSISPRAQCWPCWAAPPASSLAYWAMGLMQQFPLPPSAGRIDARLLVFALAVSLVTGLLFGVLPAIRAVTGRSRAGTQGLARRRRAETESHAARARRAADRFLACAARRRRACSCGRCGR